MLKKEAMEAGVRAACALGAKAGVALVKKVTKNEKVNRFLNSGVGNGLFTSAIGLGLGKYATNQTMASIGHECRVMGLARAGVGVADAVFTPKKQEECCSKEQAQ